MDFFNDIHIGIYAIFVIVVSFVISYRMIPLIIYTVRYKKLMDHPNERSSHSEITPTLAGVAFFGSLVISIFFMQKYDQNGIGFNIIASLTVLFFLGLKDDLMVLSSKTKVIVQSIAILFILIQPELQIIDLHGFFEIYKIPMWLGIGFSYFIVLYIINAYNLIDGIDGLAAMLGIVISMIFALMFYFAGLYYYTLLAITIIGFLIAFFRFNISDKNKIFMGDTGSMIVGFLLGLMTLRFITLNTQQLEQINILPENVFIVCLSILFFPIIDVIRVIMVRIINRKGAFSADRRHMHHVFIDKGLAHLKASFTFTISNIVAFLFIYLSNSFLSYLVLTVLFVIITFVTFYLLLLLDTDPSARVQRKKIKTYIPKKIYQNEFRIRKSIIVFLKKVFYRNML